MYIYIYMEEGTEQKEKEGTEKQRKKGRKEEQRKGGREEGRKQRKHTHPHTHTLLAKFCRPSNNSRPVSFVDC
jgi:hypothetical protein